MKFFQKATFRSTLYKSHLVDCSVTATAKYILKATVAACIIATWFLTIPYGIITNLQQLT
jgi:hypothetical protein